MMDAYRKELKYVVDDAVLCEVRNRIGPIMQIDPHQKGDYYRIRSIYLDSPDYRCFRENEAGISERQKIRIRSYNGDSSKIKAEVKIRHRDTISKLSGNISRETLDALIRGDRGAFENFLRQDMDSQANSSEAKKKALDTYLMKVLGEGYMPAAMVNYERCAYIYPICNVRITFDRNIETTDDFEGFFNEVLPAVPVIEGRKHILEVKYDEFLPDFIGEMLGGILPMRSSFSKYAGSVYALRGEY